MFNEKDGLSEMDFMKDFDDLKRTLRFLINKREIYREMLKITQRKLLISSQKQKALLNKLIHNERDKLISSDDELTEESSTDDDCDKPEPRMRQNNNKNNSSTETSYQS